MVPGPPTCLITPSSGRSSIPSLLPASCGVHSGEARNYSPTVITNQLCIFGLRILPATPSLCTSFAQSSFALHPTSSLFLSSTFEVQTIPLLMPCPVFRCSSSVNSPRRQIWNSLPCLPQQRPSGRSPSLSPVSSHCPFHLPHLLCWNSPVCFLLSCKAMDSGWAVPLRLLCLAVRSVQSRQCAVTCPTGFQAIPHPSISSQQGNSLPGTK